MRVLFVARYRDATMQRKVEYLAAEAGLELRCIEPMNERDPLLAIRQRSQQKAYAFIALPMIGAPSDPHRAIYRTPDFGVRAFRPDIIHAEEEPDSLAALQVAMVRRVFAPHARLLLHTWQNIARPMKPHVRAVMAMTLKSADAIFCANCEAPAVLRGAGYCGPTPLVPAVGVDTEIFRPCIKQPAGERPHFVVAFLGRLVPEKGVDTLLQAAALLRSAGSTGCDIRVRIIGDGPAKASLQALAADLDLASAVEFVASMPPVQVAATLCDLDALVLPSRTTSVWKEQLGRVLLEAMASGVPVVGSDSGAIPEVIGDAGIIFPEGNATALANCLAQLHGDRILYQSLAARGLARVEATYSQRQLALATAHFYRQIVGRA